MHTIMIIQLNCNQGLAIPISILNKYSLTGLSFYFVATEKHAKMYINELLLINHYSTTIPLPGQIVPNQYNTNLG